MNSNGQISSKGLIEAARIIIIIVVLYIIYKAVTVKLGGG